MNSKKMLVILSSALLFGCKTIPMSEVDDLSFCHHYGYVNSNWHTEKSIKTYDDEMKRRGILSDEELETVKKRKLSIGMPRCSVYAAWGSPSKENTTTTSYGTKIQHIYRGFRSSSSYVYTENGKITGIQN